MFLFNAAVMGFSNTVWMSPLVQLKWFLKPRVIVWRKNHPPGEPPNNPWLQKDGFFSCVTMMIRFQIFAGVSREYRSWKGGEVEILIFPEMLLVRCWWDTCDGLVLPGLLSFHVQVSFTEPIIFPQGNFMKTFKAAVSSRSHSRAVWCNGHEHCKLTSLVRGRHIRGHYGVVKTQVEWAPQCACKTVHSLIFRATERRAFEVKIPLFLFWFWKNNILPVGTWFYRSAMYSPWFWPKRTRRHDFLSSQSDISSCFAEMWSQK